MSPHQKQKVRCEMVMLHKSRVTLACASSDEQFTHDRSEQTYARGGYLSTSLFTNMDDLFLTWQDFQVSFLCIGKLFFWQTWLFKNWNILEQILSTA